MSYPPPPPPAPPPPPPGYGPQPNYGVVPAGPETHNNAIIAMILGILGVTSCSIVTGIPALIFGYKAKREIDAEPHRYAGRGMALAGIITGWISCGLCVAGGLFYILIFAIAAASGTS